MYIGSTAMIIPAIQKARQNNNFLMGTCAIGAGAIISMGLGKIASGIFNRAVDKVVDFCDDVKPKSEEANEEDKAEEDE